MDLSKSEFYRKRCGFNWIDYQLCNYDDLYGCSLSVPSSISRVYYAMGKRSCEHKAVFRGDGNAELRSLFFSAKFIFTALLLSNIDSSSIDYLLVRRKMA